MKVYFDPILGKLRRNDLKEAIAYFNSMGIYALVTVANYSAFPAPNTVAGYMYICISSQGTSWLPGSLGGTYYPEGFYYSTGSAWIYSKTAYQALQATVDAGLVDNQFVSPLTFNNAAKWSQYALKEDGLVSGGAITVGTYGGAGTDNDARVAAATWYISPTTYSTVVDTDFLDIALSAAGLQRYVGFYGDNTGTITKVEGAETEYAAYPSTPVGSIVIGYILVTDASSGAAPDLSIYATINPRITSITSSAVPTLNTDSFDVLNITALATNITSMTTNLTGTPGNFKDLIVKFKDNGVARTITWGAKFASLYATLPTTTITGKTLVVGFRYDTVSNTWQCWVFSYSV